MPINVSLSRSQPVRGQTDRDNLRSAANLQFPDLWIIVFWRLPRGRGVYSHLIAAQPAKRQVAHASCECMVNPDAAAFGHAMQSIIISISSSSSSVIWTFCRNGKIIE